MWGSVRALFPFGQNTKLWRLRPHLTVTAEAGVAPTVATPATASRVTRSRGRRSGIAARLAGSNVGTPHPEGGFDGLDHESARRRQPDARLARASGLPAGPGGERAAAGDVRRTVPAGRRAGRPGTPRRRGRAARSRWHRGV